MSHVIKGQSEIGLESIEAVLSEAKGVLSSIYERSVHEQEGMVYLLARVGAEKKLITCGGETELPEVEDALEHRKQTLSICPTSPQNAQTLRARFAWTQPRPIGKRSALGCGDRLGLATPGHLRACRGKNILPVLAQQSIREMERTGRSPQEVLDDVTWAVFQEGYTGGFGADADHLKTTEHVDRCFEVGYTMYTIDPSDYVDNEADHLGEARLHERFQALPWEALGSSPGDFLHRYVSDVIEVKSDAGTIAVAFEEAELKRAAVKYGAALAHTKAMAGHIAGRYAEERPGEAYDLEMSVDETDHPTRPREHYLVAAELERLGVEVTSLAPRFVGDFQKGIDFIGDLGEFEETFEQHAIIAEAHGGYKISIHSGSDKFSVFPIMGQYAGEHVHLKTAGTSYLEALRIPARHDPDFFRSVVEYAFERFGPDKKTYHVTTDLDAIPDPDDVADEVLEQTYLDESNGRQLLHITYGSVLTAADNSGLQFKDHLFELLDTHEEEHYEALRSHFEHHIESVGGLP